MIIYSKVTDQPGSEPATLDEAKKQVKMEGTTLDDSYLTALITTSRKICEAYTGLSFVSQERTIKMDQFPINRRMIYSWSNHIIVPYGPVISVDSFTYNDSDDVEQTLVEDTDFTVDDNSELCRLAPVDSWPCSSGKMNSVVIVYTAGFAEFPGDLKTAMLRVLANLYEFRTDSLQGGFDSVDYSAKMILDNYKVTWNANAD